MGSVIGTAASGLGSLVGNVISSPFNGVSCERVCSGTWDLLCFIEHLCVTSVLKFILAVILVLIVLYVFYLLCKLGVVKCLAKNACKLVYMPCWGGCRVLHHLWRKVRDTERVYRGRRGQRRQQPDDIELGDLSTSSYDVDYRGSSPSPSSSDYSGHHRGGAAAGRSSRWESSSSASVRGRRKDRLRQSLRPRRASSKVEHAMRISRQSDSERRHPHSIGARRKEASSLHDHDRGSAARDHSHAHRRT
ncbi:uncharacterized protein [Miscanthus floridulus]|uniref:uncharacterized protein n=1 Tax=Miscanthus floridulus TaxID=154761 RepID=UPI003458DDEC